MTQDGIWFELFDDGQMSTSLAFTDEGYELVDEHEHMWEMESRAALVCLSCGARHKMPRRRSSLAADRTKPGER